jgi:hypothetical protein
LPLLHLLLSKINGPTNQPTNQGVIGKELYFAQNNLSAMGRQRNKKEQLALKIEESSWMHSPQLKIA